MPPKIKRRIVEDPNNTWNHQLMQACLRHNVEEAEALLANGADPVEARETVPFYGEPLSPLVALLLRGRTTPEAVTMMNWLIDKGATVSHPIPLLGRQLTTQPGEEGTLLHLLVQLGQPLLLLEVLSLTALPRPPPLSIIRRLPRDVAGGSAAASAGRSPSRAGSEPGGAAHPNPNAGASRRSIRQSKVLPSGGGDASLSRSMAGMSLSARTLAPDMNFAMHLKGEVALVDFDARTSVSSLTAMELAFRRGDALTVQLLQYYGCSTGLQRLVNGRQTALAQACANGDREQVESLLESGDSIGQISLDGRYTLIHYAAGHPAVLDALLARGLSIDVENALGETTLISLICYGQGNNADYAIREAPRSSDVTRLAGLPAAVLQNYILTPLQPLVVPASKMAKSGAAGGNSSGTTEVDFPAITPLADAWWYFASTSTWVMIQNLMERGADIHGEMSRADDNALAYRTHDNKQGISYTTAVHALSTMDESFSKLNVNSGVSNQSTGTGAQGLNIWQTTPSEEVLPSIPQLTRLTPLMHAIVAYHPELIRRLLVEHRVDPMVRDAQGACALHYAALACNSTVMELLLSPLVAPFHEYFDVNTQDCRGRTPLHYAAAYGNEGAVRALLAVGPGLHAGKADYIGLTPLHLAVLASEKAVVERLLSYGEALTATTSIMDLPSSVSAGGASGGVSALSSLGGIGPGVGVGGPGGIGGGVGGSAGAAAIGGGSPSSKRRGGNTRRKRRSSVCAGRESPVMEPVAMVDVEAEDALESLTALEMAVRRTRHAGVARVLLVIGYASVRHTSGLPRGGSLLHRTVHDGMLELLTLLLEHYADPSEVDDDDHTPLHLATASPLPQATDMVRELLRYGAASEAQSSVTLDTPILIAARRGEAELLGLLLQQQEEFDGTSSSHARRTRERNIALRHHPTSPSQAIFGGNLRSEKRRNSANTLSNVVGSPLSNAGRSRRAGRRRPSFSSASPSPQRGAKRGTRMHQSSSSSQGSMDSFLGGAKEREGRRGPAQRSPDEEDEEDDGDTRRDRAGHNDDEEDYDDVDACGGSFTQEGVLEVPLLVNPQHLLLTDGQVCTPLHHLCAQSETARQDALLPYVFAITRCVLGPTLVLQIDGNGRLPLHEACASGFAAAVMELLRVDDGGSAFFVDARGCTPLHEAVMADDAACITALVENVRVWAPCRLRGVSAAADDPKSVPITTRLLQQQGKGKSCGLNVSSVKVPNSTISGDGGRVPLRGEVMRQMWVGSVWEYLNLPDGVGRTPLLLAAEMGKQRAAMAIMAQVRRNPRPSRPATAFSSTFPPPIIPAL